VERKKRPTCRYNILTRPKGIFCAKIGIISIADGLLLCYNYRWSGQKQAIDFYIFPSTCREKVTAALVRKVGGNPWANPHEVPPNF